MRLLWLTMRGASGASTQTEILANALYEHPDIEEIDVMKSRPLNIGHEDVWIEGDVLYPVDSVADAIEKWSPDVCMMHIHSKRMHKIITETDPEITYLTRIGANFTEHMLSGSGNLNHLGPLVDYVNAVDHVVSASDRTTDQIISFGVDPENITTIPTVHDFSDMKDPVEGTDFDFGLLGRLERVKNQPIIVQALSILEQRGYECDVKFAGNPSGDEIEKFMQNLVPKLGISDSEVDWMGYIDPPEVYWPEVTVNCVPSWTEHCPSVVLEAGKHGVPSILADLEWAEQFGPSFPKADPDNPMEWANRIEYLIQNEDQRIETTEKQQHTLKMSYHVDDWIDEYVRTFEEADRESDIILTP